MMRDVKGKKLNVLRTVEVAGGCNVYRVKRQYCTKAILLKYGRSFEANYINYIKELAEFTRKN